MFYILERNFSWETYSGRFVFLHSEKIHTCFHP